MRWLAAGVVLGAGLLLSGCGDAGGESRPPPAPPAASPTTGASPSEPASPEPGATAQVAAITVMSSAFADGAPIPAKYSCRGENMPPPLAWTGAAPGTVAFALVMDDPDAVGGLYIHWVISDIPPTTRGSAEGAAPVGGRVGLNSGGRRAYLGPCPPGGTGVHHYRFTVYALSTQLDLPDATPARQAVDAIAKAATAQGRLVGTSTG